MPEQGNIEPSSTLPSLSFIPVSDVGQKLDISDITGSNIDVLGNILKLVGRYASALIRFPNCGLCFVQYCTNALNPGNVAVKSHHPVIHPCKIQYDATNTMAPHFPHFPHFRPQCSVVELSIQPGFLIIVGFSKIVSALLHSARLHCPNLGLHTE